MTKSKLEQIQDRLAEIQEQLEEKRKEAATNREACIAMIRFVTDTINAVAPDQVEAQWIIYQDNTSYRTLFAF